MALRRLARKYECQRKMEIVFLKLRFQIVFRPHENEKTAFSNSSDLISVFEKLRFHED